MDNNYALASKEDIWRLQGDMKSVYAVQAEHADRLQRLERRSEDDGRTKSVWGATPSFHSVRGGTPHQDSTYNPAAEAFKNFDQDHSASLLGSLHIDTEEEPRRGASRANSVRFDESALHGQLSHTSRSSSEFFPLRTGSAFGSHPLTERSSSHKSEGRQSSTGMSTHSAGLNGLGFDQQNQETLELQARPAPGLLLLGPHPSIIRCWLGSRYSNDSLRYVALSTGATCSTIARSWLHELSLQDQVYREGEDSKIKLQIALPEATVQQRSINSGNFQNQLPMITATLTVSEVSADAGTIQCFIGSDVLRSRNGDVLFSQDRLTIFDDCENKLSVPLVRPEHASTYEQLRTTNSKDTNATNYVNPTKELRIATNPAEETSIGTSNRPKTSYSRLDWSRVRQGKPESPLGSGTSSPPPRESDSDALGGLKKDTSLALQTKSSRDIDIAVASPNPNTPLHSEESESWTSWRKNAGREQRKETFSSVASNSSQKGANQGKGMKVLKARRMSSHKSVSAAETTRPEPSPSIWGAVSPADTSRNDSSSTPYTDSPRRSFSSDLRSAFTNGTGNNRASNPVGGASAFGWLNPSQTN